MSKQSGRNEDAAEEDQQTAHTDEPGDEGVLDAATHPQTPGAAWSARGERDDEEGPEVDPNER